MNTVQKVLGVTLALTGLLSFQLVLTEPRSVWSQTPAVATLPLPTAEEAVVTMERRWKTEYETYFRRSLSTQPLRRTRAIQRTLRTIAQETGKRTALLYVVPTPETLELIVVTPDARPVLKLLPEAPRTKLLAVAQQFRLAASDPRRVNDRNYLESAQQLYQWLVAPIESILKAQSIDILVFCTGAGLRSVPFPALHDGQQFLIEKYSVALIPAFNLIKTRHTDLRQASVLATGASQFSDLNPLPAVPLELQTIVQTQGGQTLLNQQFTLDNIKAQRQQQPFRVVHMATHGEFRPGAVENSFIQLWDQRLQLDDIRQMRLNSPPVDLLVLSACRTALGNQQAELGFAGLAVQTGVKSAVGSLWYVSDAGTLALMSEFYRELRTTPTKAVALQQAQIAMLRGNLRIQEGRLQNSETRSQVSLSPELAAASAASLDLSHPYYWAAFTMIGSPW
jgi:CHAT domain-containing protein